MENAKRWYAVQIGDNTDCGWGSNDYDKALALANEWASDPDNDGQEIRIVVTDGTDDFALDVIVVRDESKYAIVRIDSDGSRDFTLAVDYNTDNYSIAELEEIAQAWTEEDNDGTRYEVIEK